IQGDIRLTGGAVEFRDLSGSFGEGVLRGTIVYNLRQPERGWYNISIERVDAAKILGPLLSATSATSATSEPVGGTASPITGPLEIQLRGNLGSEWHGTGSIALGRGKVYGAEVGEWRLPITLSYTPSQGTGQLDFSDNSAQ